MRGRWKLLGVCCFAASRLIFSAEADPSVEAGNRLLASGQWQEAVPRFQEALQREPTDLEAQVNLGCAMALLGKSKEASALFEQALISAEAVDQPFIHFNLGGLWAKEAMATQDAALFHKASAAFRKAAALIPGTETTPGWVLAFDEMHHTAMFAAMREKLGSIESYVLSVDEVGLAPDSLRFLPADHCLGKETGGRGKICQFDGTTPPMLYFYRSPSTELIQTTAALERGQITEAADGMIHALSRLDQEPSTNRFDGMQRWNAYMGLALLANQNHNLNAARSYFRKAEALGFQLKEEQPLLMALHLGARNYTAAKQVAEVLLQADPNNSFARQVAALETRGPRLRLDGAGYYRAESYGLSVKWPEQWLLFDEQTNAEQFAEKVGNNNRAGVVAIFQEEFSNGSAVMMLQARQLVRAMDEQAFVSALNNNLKPGIHESAEVMNIGQRRVIRQVAHTLGAQGENPETVIYYHLFQPPMFYTLSFHCPRAQLDAYRQLVNDTLTSWTITPPTGE